MCAGVSSLENEFQLSGCTSDFMPSQKIIPKIIVNNIKSFVKIIDKVEVPSILFELPVLPGDNRCSKIKCVKIKSSANKPSKKCIAVNLRIDHETTVELPRIPATTSSPSTGITLSKFRITRAAQNDILPDTTTYPVNAVPRAIRKSTAPITQIKSFPGVTTVENAIAFEKCAIVEIITKFAPSMWSNLSNHTKLP